VCLASIVGARIFVKVWEPVSFDRGRYTHILSLQVIELKTASATPLAKLENFRGNVAGCD